MRTGIARRRRRCSHASMANQMMQPASAATATANNLASGTCSADRPPSSAGIYAALSSASGEHVLQRLLEIGHGVDGGQRNLVVLGDLCEQPVGVAVVVDDQLLRARCGQLDELIGQGIAAFLA